MGIQIVRRATNYCRRIRIWNYKPIAAATNDGRFSIRCESNHFLSVRIRGGLNTLFYYTSCFIYYTCDIEKSGNKMVYCNCTDCCMLLNFVHGKKLKFTRGAVRGSVTRGAVRGL